MNGMDICADPGNLLHRLWSDPLSNPSLSSPFPSCPSATPPPSSTIHTLVPSWWKQCLPSQKPNYEHYLDVKSEAMQHAIPALIQLYVDVESTGAASQFYEKFNIRYYISLLIRYKNLLLHNVDACGRGIPYTGTDSLK